MSQHKIKVGANEACKNRTEGHRESSNLSGKNKICNIKWSMLLGAVGQTWTALSLLSLHHRVARGVTVSLLVSVVLDAGRRLPEIYYRFINLLRVYWHHGIINWARATVDAQAYSLLVSVSLRVIRSHLIGYNSYS